MEYDDAISNLGNLKNRYQILLFIFLSFYCIRIDSIAYSFMTIESNFSCDWNRTFAVYNMSLEEYLPVIGNLTREKCLINLPPALLLLKQLKCVSWVYDSRNSIISEFNLVCDQEYLINAIQASLWIGYSFAVLVGIVSDRFGRRNTVIIFSIVDIVSGGLQVFSVSPWMFMVLRFVCGLANSVCYVMQMLFQELSNTKSRIISGNFFWIFWIVGYCNLSLLAYLLPYWRYLHAASVLLVSPGLLYFLCIPESPRWLILKNRRKEAQATVDHLSKLNNTDKVSLDDVKLKIDTSKNILSYVKNGKVIPRLAFVVFIWFTTTGVYYGISLNITFATENPYLSNFLMGISEAPALFTGYFLSKRFGYKISLYSLLCVTSACILTIPFVYNILALRAILAIIGKIAITAEFNMMIIFCYETFSTDIRNTGSLSSSLSRFSTVIVPYINDLKNVHYYIPPLIYGLTGIATCISIVPFPETKGRPMIQNVSDLPKLQWQCRKSACEGRSKPLEMEDLKTDFVEKDLMIKKTYVVNE